MRAPLLILLLALFQDGVSQIIPNDPLFNQQRYIQDLKIDKAWERTQGNSNQTLIIFSNGRTVENEDIRGARFVFPFVNGWNSNTIGSPLSIATGGVSSIFGANTNNNFGIAGINRYAKIHHENFLRLDKRMVEVGPLPNGNGTTINAYVTDLKEAPSLISTRLSAMINSEQSFRERTIGLVTIPLYFTNPFIVPEAKWQLYPTFHFEDLSGFGVNMFFSVKDFISRKNANSSIKTDLDAWANSNAVKGVPVFVPMPDYDHEALDFFSNLNARRAVTTIGGLNLNGNDKGFKTANSPSGYNADRPYVQFGAHAYDLTVPIDTLTFAKTDFNAGAASIAAGVASLMKDLKPSLLQDDIRSILSMTAIDVHTPGYDGYTGFGRIDADAATKYAAEYSFSHINDVVAENLANNQVKSTIQLANSPHAYKIDVWPRRSSMGNVSFETNSVFNAVVDVKSKSATAYATKNNAQSGSKISFTVAEKFILEQIRDHP
jgi:hypothetical protein